MTDEEILEERKPLIAILQACIVMLSDPKCIMSKHQIDSWTTTISSMYVSFNDVKNVFGKGKSEGSVMTKLCRYGIKGIQMKGYQFGELFKKFSK